MPFPVDEQHIAAAEQVLGIRLPDAVRRRLAVSNGGELEAADEPWWLFPVRDPSDHKRLARSTSDIVSETASARTQPGFPANAVALASNDSGDLLVLRDGNVYRWDHETREMESVECAL